MPTTLLTPLILSLVLATPAQDSARRPAATPQPSRRDSLQALEAVKVRAPKARSHPLYGAGYEFGDPYADPPS
ncbi:MAG: hypothetical protein HEQ38_06680 [Gemmatimonas sp.]|nr:hypothetical protein [Gemmatimonas sp.]